MGWTSTTARHYTENGKVNRKAECEHLYTWEDERRENKVLKSSMRCNVYYAAVKTTDKNTGHLEMFAAVCLTSTKWDGGFNFGYKGMTEDCGPCEDDCPKDILDLLTDTESEYAKEWRERSYETTISKLYKLTAKGEIPSAKINGKLSFLKSNLLEWVENQINHDISRSNAEALLADSARRKNHTS